MSSNITQNHNERNNNSNCRGKVFVVGIGPGSYKQLTTNAIEVIKHSSVIVGYKRYLDLVSGLITDQNIISSGMREEIDRCRKALAYAEKGEIVSVISSGDSGIYGMAGLILELNESDKIDIEIVPGVSAVSAAASLLGAPLMNDLALISLSDLLTPWEVIEKRVNCASEGDFVIGLYNPKSKKRVHQIEIVKDIIIKYRSGNTPVGIVTNAYRENQKIEISNLDNFLDLDIGMLSIVIVGNSQTFEKSDRLITHRGYEKKYCSIKKCS